MKIHETKTRLYSISNLSIRLLSEEDISAIVDEFQKVGWPKPAEIFFSYLLEQNMGSRLAWVAYVEDQLSGYVTLKWESKYEPFFIDNIPEVMDLNVLPQFRELGIASRLLSIAETEAATKSDNVGIGFGIYGGDEGVHDQGYGAAQRLYIKRGYIPDGKGGTYNYKRVKPGGSYPVDDDLVLWCIKKLR